MMLKADGKSELQVKTRVVIIKQTFNNLFCNSVEAERDW